MTASSQIGQMTADLEVFFCVNADCLLDLLAMVIAYQYTQTSVGIERSTRGRERKRERERERRVTSK